MPLMDIKVGTIEETTLAITDAQIVLKEPKEVKIELWRNYKGIEKLRIIMPWRGIFTIASNDPTEEYAKIVKQLKSGKAKIEIGESFSIISA